MTLPAAAKTMTLCTTAKIRYSFGAFVPTTSKGLWLDAGCTSLLNDHGQLADFQFIDDAAGASSVTIEYQGSRY